MKQKSSKIHHVQLQMYIQPEEKNYIKIPMPTLVLFKNKQDLTLVSLAILVVLFMLGIFLIKLQTSTAQSSSLLGIILTGLITGGLTLNA